MASLIKTDGSETTVKPKNGKQFTLEELQAFVGGSIELLMLPNGREMYLNEDGKFNGSKINNRATVIAAGAGIADNDFAAGDVIICDRSETNDDNE